MASPNPADYFVTPSLASFFIDESEIKIDGRTHLLSCALLTEDNNVAIQDIVALKATLGIRALDEVKFNSSGLSKEKKIAMTDGVLDIMQRCTMFICISEGIDKGALAESAAQQAFDYCVEEGVKQFSLNFDAGLVPNKKKLEDFVTGLRSGDEPDCVGIQPLDSSRDQIVQLCDLFLGLFRLTMQIEFGERQIPRKIHREQFECEEEWSLSEVVLIGTRGHIWGKTKLKLYDVHPDEGEIYHPYHVSFGMGLRVNSSIAADTLSLIEEKLATTYLGCMD